MGARGADRSSGRLAPRHPALCALTLVIAGAIVGLAACTGSGGVLNSSPTTVPSIEPGHTDPGSESPDGEPDPSVSAAPDPSDDAEELTIITLDVVDGEAQATGILPGSVDSDGECTLTLRRGEDVQSASVPVTPGRDSIYCGQVAVRTVGLDAGEWTVVLTYRSMTKFAQSTPATVTLP